jgi:ribosomal-protein-alanine N-acetyltransferase
VRPARAAECGRLAALLRASFPEGWSAASLAALLASGRGGLLVAEDAQGPAGVLVAERVVDELHVHALAVDGRARRRGLGAALLGAALADARSAGLARVHLELRASNAAALALYQRFGFERVGRRAGYYAGVEDALLLRLELAGGEPDAARVGGARA